MKVLGDRRLGNGERCSKLFHRTVGKRQQIDNLPAGGIGDGFESRTRGVLHKRFLMRGLHKEMLMGNSRDLRSFQ